MLLLVLGAPAVHATTLFTGPYAPEHWQTSGDGTASITPPAGSTDSVLFAYDMGDAFSGARTFSVVAAANELLSFDWALNGCHSYWETSARLAVFADGPGGPVITDLYSTTWEGCGFSGAGSAVIEVHEGCPFGFLIEGGHGDSAQLLFGNANVLGTGSTPTAGPPVPPVVDNDGHHTWHDKWKKNRGDDDDDKKDKKNKKNKNDDEGKKDKKDKKDKQDKQDKRGGDHDDDEDDEDDEDD